MLATLTTTGSSSASTQTECGASLRSIRRATISCSARSFARAQQLLAEVVVDRRVGAAAGRAGERDRRGPGARGGGPAAPGWRRGTRPRAMPTQKQKHDGKSSRRAPKTAAGSWAGGASTRDLARQHHLLELARADPLDRGGDRVLVGARAAQRSRSRLRSLGLRVERAAADASRKSGEARARAARRRARRLVAGRRSTLRVRQVARPARSSESSGSTSSAGGSDDQCGARPPSGANAKPPAQTGPAPAGRPRARRRAGRAIDFGASSRDQVGEALGPARDDLVRRAERRRGRSRRDRAAPRQNQRSPASREANTAATGSLDLDRRGDADDPPPRLGRLERGSSSRSSEPVGTGRARRASPDARRPTARAATW